MTCAAGTCIGALGDPCVVDNDCANGVKCTNGLCRDPVPTACTMDIQCSTGYCKSNMCTACSVNSNCNSSFYPAKPICDFVNGVASCLLGFPPKCQ